MPARKTIDINDLKNVEIRDCAMGDVSATRNLKVMEDGRALGPRSQMAALETADGRVQAYRVMRPDDRFPDRCFSIIHFDTEGYEFRILDGARAIIARCAP